MTTLIDCGGDFSHIDGERLFEVNDAGGVTFGRVERQAHFASVLDYPDNPDRFEWFAHDYMNAPGIYTGPFQSRAAAVRSLTKGNQS